MSNNNTPSTPETTDEPQKAVVLPLPSKSKRQQLKKYTGVALLGVAGGYLTARKLHGTDVHVAVNVDSDEDKKD